MEPLDVDVLRAVLECEDHERIGVVAALSAAAVIAENAPLLVRAN